MKKIGIITFWKSYNYGALFQAYATFKFISDRNNKVVFINYENENERRLKNFFSYRKDYSIYRNLKNNIKSIFLGTYFYNKKSFNTFIKKLPSTTEYSTYKDLYELKNKEKFDILVVGSDQVWNPEITGGEIEKAFLLGFDDSTRKISYASSMGSYNLIKTIEKEIFYKYLNRFEKVSVREIEAKNELENIGIKNIQVVSDPVLLLKKEEWDVLANKKNKYNDYMSKKYIFIYLMTSYEQHEKEILEIKRKLNLPVILISFSLLRRKGVDKHILGATPEEFLFLLKNATVVLTSSFHGVVFSTIYNKKFIALENKKNPKRVRGYLKKLGLESRILRENFLIDSYLDDIDYEEINKKIYNLQMNSRKWLEESINDGKK